MGGQIICVVKDFKFGCGSWSENITSLRTDVFWMCCSMAVKCPSINSWQQLRRTTTNVGCSSTTLNVKICDFIQQKATLIKVTGNFLRQQH